MGDFIGAQIVATLNPMVTIVRTGNKSMVDPNANIRIVDGTIVLSEDERVTEDQDQQGQKNCYYNEGMLKDT